MTYPAATANLVVLWGRWWDHLTKAGVDATITATPLLATGQAGSGSPNLVSLVDQAEIKTAAWSTKPLPGSGLWALPLLPTNDAQFGAFGGYRIQAGSEPPFIVEILENTPTMVMSADMIAALNAARTQSNAAPIGISVNDVAQAVWVRQAAVLQSPAVAPPAGVLTSDQVVNLVAGVRQLPPGGTPGQVPTPKVGGGYEWIAQTGGGSASVSDASTTAKGVARIADGTADDPKMPWSKVTGKPTFSALATSSDAAGLTGLIDDARIPASIARDSETQAAIDALIGGAPGTRDTLKEISDVLNADEGALAALTTVVGGKADKLTQRTTAAVGATTAAANEIVPLDTVNGTFTLTGPAGATYWGWRWKAGPLANAPTIAAANGYTINGAATITPSLAPAGSPGELSVYELFGTDYQVIGGNKPQSALDARAAKVNTLLPGWAAATDGCVFWQTQRTDITGVTGCNFRQAYTVLGPDLVNARLVFANFGVQDDPGPNPITVSCTVEQGFSPWRCNVTFNGRDSVTIDPGGLAVSDPIAVRVATNGKLYLRTFVSVADTTKTIPVNYYQGAGDFRIDATQTDVRSSSTFTSTASHWGYGPVAILGDTLPADLVAFIGASLTYGVGDFPNHIGWSSRWAARDVVPYLKLATPGEKAVTFAQPYYSHRRLAVVTGASVALCAHGVNDGYGPPATTDSTRTAMQTIWQDLKRRGVRKVYQTTITPATTSTDSWATVAGQADDTVRWSTAQLAELNAWIRSKPAPLDGVIDMADIVMTARDSNRWRPGYTADGIHPSTLGHLAMVDSLPPLGNLGGTIPTAPTPVTGVTATAASSSSVALTWAAADRAETYRVEYKTRSASSWTVASSPSGTTYTVTGLSNNTIYDFRVRAVNRGGVGIEGVAAVTLGTPVSTYAADSFTRANASGAPGSTETGNQPWTSTGATFGITSNTLQQQGGIGGHSHCLVDTGQANGTVAVMVASASAQNRGLFVRASADGSTGYVFFANNAGYRLRRITSSTGTTTTIQDTTSPAPAVGDVLSVVLDGPSIVCKVNGTTVITATDATYTGTRHGLWVSYGSNGQQWDNFSHAA